MTMAGRKVYKSVGNFDPDNRCLHPASKIEHDLTPSMLFIGMAEFYSFGLYCTACGDEVVATFEIDDGDEEIPI